MSALRRLSTKLARLFGSRDPSAKWKRDPNLDIVLDLDTGTFCGVAFGEPIERLSGLGKCEEYFELGAVFCTEEGCDLEHESGFWLHLEYGSRGFCVACTEDCIFDSLDLVVDPLEKCDKPYRHAIRLQGGDLTLPSDPDSTSIRALFGPPDDEVDHYDLPEDQNHAPKEHRERFASRPKSYTYHFGHIEAIIMFDRQDRAHSIVVHTPRKQSESGD